jgi:hypothetical protein
MILTSSLVNRLIGMEFVLNDAATPLHLLKKNTTEEEQAFQEN